MAFAGARNAHDCHSLKTSHRRTSSDTTKAIDNIRNNAGIVLDKPLHVQFATLDKRRKTFEKWPSECGQDPQRLAEAGFFCEGGDDCVTCFHCSLSLKDWSRDEDPWKVHAQLFPYCAHIRQCKGDHYVLELLGWTVNHKTALELAISRNKTAYEAVKFIYTDEDIIRKALKYLLRNDDKKLFLAVELAQTVEDIMSGGITETRGEEDKDLSPQARNDYTDGAGDVSEDDLLALEAENRTLKDNMACKICFDGVACVITLPCGHMASCPQCISAITVCPLCRSGIQGTIRAKLGTCL